MERDEGTVRKFLYRISMPLWIFATLGVLFFYAIAAVVLSRCVNAVLAWIICTPIVPLLLYCIKHEIFYKITDDKLLLYRDLSQCYALDISSISAIGRPKPKGFSFKEFAMAILSRRRRYNTDPTNFSCCRPKQSLTIYALHEGQEMTFRLSLKEEREFIDELCRKNPKIQVNV